MFGRSEGTHKHGPIMPKSSTQRGSKLGLTMVRLILAQLVHCFEWKLLNGISPHELDMSEKFGSSVPRANHLIVVPNYRIVKH
ncbi:hypothetical protein BVC80_1211g79 [Macleaya cordata]|uniref:Cytochrome P450 n=1 Tax=Macleaya cordata TaxID=56857 RepID=A0A200Q3G9_MACCD|nr:hypothetical protein BVC80_1211g79 [Macleaya cordata]